MSMNQTYEAVDMDSEQPGNSARKHTIKRFTPLAIVAGLLVAAYAADLHSYLSFDTLSANKALIDAFVAENFALAMVAYLLIYIAAVSLSFPGASLLTIAGGGIFGWFIGGTLTLVGATIGASIIFLIAKTSIGDYLAEKAGPRMTKLRAGFQKNAFSYLLTLRLAPVVPVWITNLAPALFGMDLLRYATATFIGIIPGTYAYSFIGNQAGAAVGGSDITQKITLGLAALALASLVPLLIKWVQHQKNPSSDQ